VHQNIAFGLRKDKLPKQEVNRMVEEALEMIKLPGYSSRRAHQLSGGQRQRIALARALIKRPKVLLLDEPLGALDKKLREQMQLELRALQRSVGITFIFVTHDQEEALTMSDRIAVMNKGRILQVGSPNDIYDRPAHRFVADFIGDTNFLSAELVESNAQGSVVKLPSGKTVAAGPTDAAVNDMVNITVRPEQAMLIEDLDEADMQGRVTNIMYSGTDSHFHIDLGADEAFVAKVQNSGPARRDWTSGQSVGIKFHADAVQIVQD